MQLHRPVDHRTVGIDGGPTQRYAFSVKNVGDWELVLEHFKRIRFIRVKRCFYIAESGQVDVQPDISRLTMLGDNTANGHRGVFSSNNPDSNKSGDPQHTLDRSLQRFLIQAPQTDCQAILEGTF